MIKECPEEGRDKIRCIDCICNLCDNDCMDCDREDCEPREIN